MVDNPQLLVRKLSRFQSPTHYDKDALLLDAVFVPFRKRGENVRALLEELHWYRGPIFLMPSDQSDMRVADYGRDGRIHELKLSETWFIDFFKNLLTTKHEQTYSYGETWDLPVKRNYALWYARRNRFDRILMLDDDIRGLSLDTLLTGSKCLDHYLVSGSFVEEFPDTSVVGHLERIAGEIIYPFLSGSFLFIKPGKVKGFFPNIYNEDWLFMLRPIMEESICAFGSINQLPYDPFNDLHRARFQEFGEVIAEGLYALLNAKKYDRRHDLQTWKETILERRLALEAVSNVLYKREHQEVIEVALQRNMMIRPEDCLTFVENWEKDLGTWRIFIEETAR